MKIGSFVPPFKKKARGLLFAHQKLPSVDLDEREFFLLFALRRKWRDGSVFSEGCVHCGDLRREMLFCFAVCPMLFKGKED